MVQHRAKSPWFGNNVRKRGRLGFTSQQCFITSKPFPLCSQSPLHVYPDLKMVLMQMLASPCSFPLHLDRVQASLLPNPSCRLQPGTFVSPHIP